MVINLDGFTLEDDKSIRVCEEAPCNVTVARISPDLLDAVKKKHEMPILEVHIL